MMNNILLAIKNEIKSLNLYKNMITLYGEAFSNLSNIKQDNINKLKQFLNDDIKINNDNNIKLSKNFINDINILINHENENIAFYNDLLDNEKDENIKDIFYHIQAKSYNDILTNLNIFNSSNFINEITKFKDTISQTINKIKNKEISQDDIINILNKINFSMLGGVAIGAIAGIVLNEIIKQKE